MNGKQFGKYQIENEIGRGGFGTVFRATDTTLDRPVAIKILDPLLMRDSTWVAHFRREARLMARLDHAHIVPIYETGTHGGRIFIAMKLIDGPNLADHLAAAGPMSWDETLSVAGQMAEALDYAHGEGLTHRDLKPSNILLANGQATLTDLGMSMLASTNTMSISVTGGVVGTPSYIPPEAWEGKEVAGAADQYALACLVCEMLTGDILFSGDTPPAIMMAHYQAPQFPKHWAAGVPPGIEGVLRTGLARKPAERYSSSGEFASALRRSQTDTLVQPYAELQAAVAGEQWAKALEIAGRIRSQDGGYRDVVALEEVALAGQLAEKKGQIAAQWREQAKAALAAGNLEVARAAALRWQESADDPAAAAFLERLDRPAPIKTEPVSATPPAQEREPPPGMVRVDRTNEPAKKVARGAASETVSQETHQRPWWLTRMSGIFVVLTSGGIIIGTLLSRELVYIGYVPSQTFYIAGAVGAFWLVTGIFDMVAMFLSHAARRRQYFKGFISAIVGFLLVIYAPLNLLRSGSSLILVIGILGLGTAIACLIGAFRGGDRALRILSAISLLFSLVLILGIISPGSVLIPFAANLIAAVIGLAGGIFILFLARRHRTEQRERTGLGTRLPEREVTNGSVKRKK